MLAASVCEGQSARIEAADKACRVSMSIAKGNEKTPVCARASTVRATLGVVVAAVAFSVGGCAEDAELVREKPPYPALEPKLVLANLTLAFENADPAILRRNLNADFTFYFNAGDVGEELTTGYVIPASWDRNEFFHAAEKLIESAHSASLKGPWDAIGSPGPGVGEYGAEVGLTFVVIQDASREYRAAGSCRFGFVKSSGGMWELASWWDYTSVLELDAGEASLGRILALYYE